VVVGAYGFVFGKYDGGQTWASWMERELNNHLGCTYTGIRKQGERILVCRRQGFFVALS